MALALEAPVSQLRNLGPASARMLEEAGVLTIGDLRSLGAEDAFLAVRASSDQRGHRPSMNLLYALAAGLKDRDWRELTPAERSRLAARVA